MNREIICTVCPRSCRITVSGKSREDSTAIGFSCPRGSEYAISECFAPLRTLTTSVTVDGVLRRRIPVRTTVPIPREKLLPCAKLLQAITLHAPIAFHQVICTDIMGTGADVITCMPLDKEA